MIYFHGPHTKWASDVAVHKIPFFQRTSPYKFFYGGVEQLDFFTKPENDLALEKKKLIRRIFFGVINFVP